MQITKLLGNNLSVPTVSWPIFIMMAQNMGSIQSAEMREFNVEISATIALGEKWRKVDRDE